MFNRPDFLRIVLLLDAATCVAMGVLMTLGGAGVASMTQIPPSILWPSGLSLFPIAAFFVLVAVRRPIPAAGVWLAVIGNAGWVAGSVALLLGAGQTFSTLGVVFIAAQAAGVALFAALEFAGLRRLQVLA